MKRNLLGILVLLSSFSVWGQNQTSKITVPLSFDSYYNYDEVVAALQALNSAYPELSRLDIVGESEEGRSIYCLTVNNSQTGTELDKPGVYVDGNIHGNEIQAGEVALYLLNFLLTNHGINEEITQVVDQNCFYVIPVVNVDGRYHFFADANTPSSNRSLRRPHDDDQDGLVDEDPPDDLDGDGNICNMRRRDPFGTYKTDPDDPRLMIRIKPGEQGEWTLIGSEGLDNDGDGKINEDAEGYVDGNRNWGYHWMPRYVQSGSGDYPFSGVGIKAIAQYIRKRPNIAVAWALHNSGGMYLRGPSQKSQGEFPRGDVEVYNYLGEQAERITPGYRYLISWKDLYGTYGDFIEWMVGVNGAYGFVAELFQSSQETFSTRAEESRGNADDDENGGFRHDPETLRQRLRFSDHLAQGDLYKPWAPFTHPTYGEIEIGGWVKFSSRLPAPFMLKDLVHRNAMAIIFSAKNTPRVELEIYETKEIGEGLFQIRTRLHNSKAIPTMSYSAQRNKLRPKDTLFVAGEESQILAGGELLDPFHNEVTYKKHRPELQFTVVPGFGKVEHQFLVSGRGSVSVTYRSAWAGTLTETVELN